MKFLSHKCRFGLAISKTNKKRKSNLFSFSERVFEVVRKIPFGEFLTYKEVAKLAGNSRACRAVGNILNKNVSPKIPCHRMIRSDGKVGGYRYGEKKKITLLKKEDQRE